MDRLDSERMFVAVLDTGSFSAAAQRLGTSSGQASKLISKLEAGLGVQLIKRTTRALSPTEVGYAYYERIKGLVQDFDALDASVRNASGAPSGRIRLTAPMSFGTLQLTPILLEFAKTFPDIQIDVSFSDRIVNLVDEGFDIGVRIGKPLDGVVCGRGRNPTLRLWPAIFSGEIDVFPSERRNMGQEIGR
ncbi:LysR family transcriptional regulator [Brucella pseudogrignonensis]|uniref:LysR family transcriptional regulator n=1 Tax=Brucella pseudogrignonensis TaxID=419475 RepID=UPI00124E6330|nr:LysR family transcriptional regulator [Brucella pseudogrignonensis]KAB2686481.1 LysR family transcriptional regulator [Brucella pseudogrignonensis]